jgi:hypothetical protein
MIGVMSRPIRSVTRVILAAAGATVLSIMAGCKTAPTEPTPVTVQPELQLIDAQPLALMEGCTVSGSLFVEFTVLTTGRTNDLKLPPVPPCVRAALTAWVGSFRYAPPASDTRSAVEWMLVTARKRS